MASFAKKPCASDHDISHFSESLIDKISDGLCILCDYLNDKSVIITQLKVTACNAADSRCGIPFSKAYCSTEESTDIFMFGDIFHRGLDILLQFIQNNNVPDTFTREEKYVLHRLLNYIEQDEQFPTEGFAKMTETERTTVLANHLFGQLATTSLFTINKDCAGKRIKDQCICDKPGCKSTGVFGDTSIGNPQVWHGNLHVIVSDAVAIEPVEDKPDSSGDKSPVKMELKSTELSRNEQIIAKTVVFSFLQKRRHPEMAHFLSPCIGVGSSEMVIMFYDSEHDVLLESSKIALLDSFFGEAKLNTLAVLVSWLVVNHKYLCSGLKDNMKSYKADFFSHAEGKMEVYTKRLQLGNVDNSSVVKKKLRSFENHPKQSQHLEEVHFAALAAVRKRKRNKDAGNSKD